MFEKLSNEEKERLRKKKAREKRNKQLEKDMDLKRKGKEKGLKKESLSVLKNIGIILLILLACIIIFLSILLTVGGIETVENTVIKSLVKNGLGLLVLIPITIWFIKEGVPLLIYFRDYGWFQNIMVSIFVVGLTFGSIYQSVKVTKLVQDIDDFEEGRFEVFTGYMESPNVSGVRNVTELKSFKVNGVKLRASELNIDGDYFYDEKIGERKVKITYLPNSRLAVDWDFADSE